MLECEEGRQAVLISAFKLWPGPHTPIDSISFVKNLVADISAKPGFYVAQNPTVVIPVGCFAVAHEKNMTPGGYLVSHERNSFTRATLRLSLLRAYSGSIDAEHPHLEYVPILVSDLYRVTTDHLLHGMPLATRKGRPLRRETSALCDN